MLHILTLTWNACDKLSKLKESLLPNLAGLDYVWHIKDNASNDATLETARTWGDKVQIHAHPNNLQNFSQGMNFLFNQAAPAPNDDVLLLNNDVIFNDDSSLKKMITILHEDKNVGVVGARLLYSGTNRLQHAGVVFKDRYNLPTHFRSNDMTDTNAEKNRVFQVVTGAVMLTKASYYKAAHKNKSGNEGMDENYHWAFDDVDLCMSIGVNQGKKIIYCGKTNIFHEESASLKKNPANRLFMSHNINYFKTKWLGKYTMDEFTYIKNVKHNLY